jgi:hypothetical protein
MAVLQAGTHPVLAAAAVIDAALAEVGAVDPVFMTVPDKERALLELSGLVDRLDELRGRVLAASGDLADRDAARDPAAWLAHHGRRDRGECRRSLSLAGSLTDHPQVAAGLREGAVNLGQARVIVRALADLPAETEPGLRTAAEKRLVAEAATFGPRTLRVLGRRVLDVLAPEVAEAHEGRLLEREEERAARRTCLTTRRNGDGTTEVRMRVADSVADRLLTYLEAFTSPRRPAPSPGSEPGVAPGDRRPYDQRLGAAFESFLEAVDPARLPLHGGDATTVLVTVPLDALREGTGTALVGDQPVSAGQARRLACTAGIIPIVLGGASEVLDAGRTRRLFTGVQRRALAITYPACATQGCEIAAAWCEAHHAGHAWSRGGRTDLADGVLLCAFHHHRAHDHHYELRRAGRTVTFHRRT